MFACNQLLLSHLQTFTPLEPFEGVVALRWQNVSTVTVAEPRNICQFTLLGLAMWSDIGSYWECSACMYASFGGELKRE